VAKVRGKFTGTMGKPWKEMTKAEKRKELDNRIAVQQEYVDGGDASKEAKAYLRRIKKARKELQ